MSDTPIMIVSTCLPSKGLNTSRMPSTRHTTVHTSVTHHECAPMRRESTATCSLNTLSTSTSRPIMTERMSVSAGARQSMSAPRMMQNRPTAKSNRMATPSTSRMK